MRSIKTIVITTALLSSATVGFADEPIATNKPPAWEASASAGLTLTRGNSESTAASLGIKAETKWAQNEIKLGADGLYGETKNSGEPKTKSAESLLGYAQYNRLFTDRWYAYMRLEAMHDGVADIKYRFTVGPGVGYYFIKQPKTELNGEVGPGFIYEKTGDSDDSYVTLRLAENFKHALNDHVRVWQKAELLPQVDDFNNYILNLEAGIEADLSSRLSFQSKILDNYDNRPASGRKCNDLKWINAISYKF